jgi:hypothetical protein
MNSSTRCCITSMLVIFVSITWLCPVLADDKAPGHKVEETKSDVDWGNGFIYSTGFGLPSVEETNEKARKRTAQEAEYLDALRNLAKIIDGIAINSETTVKDSIIAGDRIRTKIDGFIRGAVLDTVYFNKDHSAEVILKIPLNGDGSLSDILFPSKPVIIDNWQKILPPPQETDTSDTATLIKSGIVFDAHGLKITQSMSPRIYTDKGDILYSAESIGMRLLKGNGLVDWAPDVRSAVARDRVAGSPVVIKARGLKKGEENPTDLVISLEELTKLIDEGPLEFLLKNGKVVIVY